MTPPELAARLESMAAEPVRVLNLTKEERAMLASAAVALRERDRDVEAAYREGWEWGVSSVDKYGEHWSTADEDWLTSTARRASTEKR